MANATIIPGQLAGLRRAMKPDSFWQRFFGTYRFCRNFGRESWWASFRGAVRAAWGGISRAIAILVMAITSCSWTKSLVVLQCSCVVQGGYMPTLADIYEYQAEDCLRAAAKADDPQRACFDAQARRCVAKGCRSIETRRAIAARKSPAKGQSIWARCGRYARTCTYPAAA